MFLSEEWGSLGGRELYLPGLEVGVIWPWYELESLLCPCGPRPWSPDISLDAHAPILEARVHSEVNGVGGLPAVVLMDQHRVLCDVMACRVPGK